jgi:alpha-tubulin suppressor-like RCC1 family protein
MSKRDIPVLIFLFVCVVLLATPALAAGTITDWGKNTGGPATLLAGNDYTAVSAGGGSSLALKSDGSIAGWDENPGDPATPLAGNDYSAVSAGEGFSLALKSDGSIAGWGENANGQTTPPDGNDFVAISAGGKHSLALKADGSIVGWGDDSYGQATPPAGNDYIAISAGAQHSLALKADGSIVRWGYGEDTMDGNDVKTRAPYEPYPPAPEKENPVPAPEFPLASQPAILIICMLIAMLLIQRNRET